MSKQKADLSSLLLYFWWCLQRRMPDLGVSLSPPPGHTLLHGPGPSCAPLLQAAPTLSGQYGAKLDSGAGVWWPPFSRDREISVLAQGGMCSLLGQRPSVKQLSTGREWKCENGSGLF